MLLIKEIDCFYGDLQVLRGVSLEIEEKTITAIIGSNGAGKTTLLNSIVGLKDRSFAPLPDCGHGNLYGP
jgi:branched-chain amino acid transport system ATP-binding protein